MINSIEISVRSFEYLLLKSAILQIKAVCPQEYSVLQVSLPIKQKRFTVLRSPHIDKKSREQFEIKYHKTILNLTSLKDTIDNIVLLSNNSVANKEEFFLDSADQLQKMSDVQSKYPMNSSIEFFIENLKRVKFTGVQIKIRVKYSSFLEKSFL